ncbi:MAG TPA: HlyD family efflux transporter periplasmic adaptor subunit [Planctomycetota bacterium]|nr:HlyD family efflux transporter periplasmic adaptor subunit [Planctomycetota bacterium]
MRSETVLTALTAVALVLSAWLPAAAAEKPGAAPADQVRRLSASGRVEPLGEERQLQFPVPGRIAKVAVEDGQQVKAGDVVAELENGDEKAAVELAAAEAAKAQAALERVEAGARAEERTVADADAQLAGRELKRTESASGRDEELAAARTALRKAEVAEAERRVARLRKLREGETKAASQEELEGAEDRLAVARAAEAEARAAHALVAGAAREEIVEVAKARARLADERAALVKAKARAEDLAAARAALEAAKAAKAAAEARLEKTVLRAPSAGTVLKIFRRQGELAGPGSVLPVATLGDLSKLLVRAEVDENDIAKVRPGQAVSAQATGLAGQRLTGKVIRISRTMGRKRLFSEAPSERIDTKVMEVLVELDGQPAVPVGYRLDVYFLGGEEK